MPTGLTQEGSKIRKMTGEILVPVLGLEAVLDEDEVDPPWPAAWALRMVPHTQHVLHPVAAPLHDPLDVCPVPPGELHSQHPGGGDLPITF